MEKQELKEAIKRELPHLVRDDPAIRDLIIELSRTEFADKKETQDWFHQTLDEMRQERERQDRKWEVWDKKWNQYLEEQAKIREDEKKKWEAQEKKWEAQEKKWEAQEWKWEEQRKLWEEQRKLWEEQHKQWGDQQKRWEEQQKQWEEASRRFDDNHKAIMALARKHDRSIGALGARWGLKSENTFRRALASILEENFGVKVRNINEYDHEGMVFGRPEQVELDIIIKNGLLIICELKSSIDKAGMYIFERKVRFYEKKYGQKADRLMVISPMIDHKAIQVARELNIETYSDSLDVDSL